MYLRQPFCFIELNFVIYKAFNLHSRIVLVQKKDAFVAIAKHIMNSAHI